MDYEELRKATVPDEAEAGEYLVYEDCTPALEVFLSCNTQWRFGDRGALLGMDYSAVHATMQMMGIEDQKQTFFDIRILEQALIEERKRG